MKHLSDQYSSCKSEGGGLAHSNPGWLWRIEARLRCSTTLLIKPPFLFLLMLSFGVPVSAQFEIFYQPIQFEGPIPKEILENIQERTLSEISQQSSDRLTATQRKEFYTLSNYALNGAFKSGYVYFNDEISAYLNEIVDHILQDDPALRARIQVFATKFSTPNAACWRDGTIFFNISLFPYLESEAELAFILAHEIVHYQKSHSIRQFQKKKEIQRASAFGGVQDLDDLYKVLKFSRENEMEADKEGLALLTKTDYDPRAAHSALLALQEIDVQVDSASLDLVALFNSDSVEIDSANICGLWAADTIELIWDGGEEEEIEQEEEQDSTAQYSTHPSIEKRLEAISHILKADYLDTTNKVLFIGEENRFGRIRTVSYFETIERAYFQGQYAFSLYGSLRMLQAYPDNLYLHIMSCKSLYWLAFFRDQDNERAVIPHHKDFTGTQYGFFLCYLNHLGRIQMRTLAVEYAESRLAKFGSNDEIELWLGRLHELNGEKEKAQPFYQSIVDHFPESKHYEFAKYRLKSGR